MNANDNEKKALTQPQIDAMNQADRKYRGKDKIVNYQDDIFQLDDALLELRADIFKTKVVLHKGEKKEIRFLNEFGTSSTETVEETIVSPEQNQELTRNSLNYNSTTDLENDANIISLMPAEIKRIVQLEIPKIEKEIAEKKQAKEKEKKEAEGKLTSIQAEEATGVLGAIGKAWRSGTMQVTSGFYSLASTKSISDLEDTKRNLEKKVDNYNQAILNFRKLKLFDKKFKEMRDQADHFIELLKSTKIEKEAQKIYYIKLVNLYDFLKNFHLKSAQFELLHKDIGIGLRNYKNKRFDELFKNISDNLEVLSIEADELLQVEDISNWTIDQIFKKDIYEKIREDYFIMEDIHFSNPDTEKILQARKEEIFIKINEYEVKKQKLLEKYSSDKDKELFASFAQGSREKLLEDIQQLSETDFVKENFYEKETKEKKKEILNELKQEEVSRKILFYNKSVPEAIAQCKKINTILDDIIQSKSLGGVDEKGIYINNTILIYLSNAKAIEKELLDQQTRIDTLLVKHQDNPELIKYLVAQRKTDVKKLHAIHKNIEQLEKVIVVFKEKLQQINVSGLIQEMQNMNPWVTQSQWDTPYNKLKECKLAMEMIGINVSDLDEALIQHQMRNRYDEIKKIINQEIEKYKKILDDQDLLKFTNEESFADEYSKFNKKITDFIAREKNESLPSEIIIEIETLRQVLSQNYSIVQSALSKMHLDNVISSENDSLPGEKRHLSISLDKEEIPSESDQMRFQQEILDEEEKTKQKNKEKQEKLLDGKEINTEVALSLYSETGFVDEDADELMNRCFDILMKYDLLNENEYARIKKIISNWNPNFNEKESENVQKVYICSAIKNFLEVGLDACKQQQKQERQERPHLLQGKNIKINVLLGILREAREKSRIENKIDNSKMNENLKKIFSGILLNHDLIDQKEYGRLKQLINNLDLNMAVEFKVKHTDIVLAKKILQSSLENCKQKQMQSISVIDPDISYDEQDHPAAKNVNTMEWGLIGVVRDNEPAQGLGALIKRYNDLSLHQAQRPTKRLQEQIKNEKSVLVKRIARETTDYNNLSNIFSNNPDLQTALTNYYKNMYQRMVQAAERQAEEFAKKYYSGTNNQVQSSLKLLEDTKKGFEIEAGMNESPEKKLLANQLAALARELYALNAGNLGDAKNDLFFYKSKISAAYKILNEKESSVDAKNGTNLEIITKGSNKGKGFFMEVMQALFEWRLADSARTSKLNRGHYGFWRDTSYDVKESAKKAGKLISPPTIKGRGK